MTLTLMPNWYRIMVYYRMNKCKKLTPRQLRRLQKKDNKNNHIWNMPY